VFVARMLPRARERLAAISSVAPIKDGRQPDIQALRRLGGRTRPSRGHGSCPHENRHARANQAMHREGQCGQDGDDHDVGRGLLQAGGIIGGQLVSDEKLRSPAHPVVDEHKKPIGVITHGMPRNACRAHWQAMNRFTRLRNGVGYQ
jgi:hypothetical protein